MPSFIPSLESLRNKAVELFKSEFGVLPEVAGYGPGRVNLLGEHTDYNEGFVLPMALPFVTIVAGRVNSTNEVQLYTHSNDVDNPHRIKFSINEEIKPGKLKWANYVKGVIVKFQEAKFTGFDAVIVSSVPVGGGLSSSAALEVATYTFLEKLYNKRETNPINKALACQQAEHIYVGMPCGIMDQLVSVMGREKQALLIDCRTLDVTYVNFDDPDVLVLITNSNIKRELAGSEYSIRRKTCEEAAKLLGKKSLRDAVETDLLKLEKEGADKIIIARARHVIKENKRTEKGAKALQNGDYEKFGELMVESHNSLRDDYEVSCKELDDIVEAAIGVDGVYGSKMTGGGFGGCTVTLLRKEAVESCISNIRRLYFGNPVFYTCKPSAGSLSFLF